MAKTLLERLHRLLSSDPQSQMMQTAKQHCLLDQGGNFPFQRWNPTTQTLQITTQQPIGPSRMVKYIEQLQELIQDPLSVMKFQALRPADSAKVVPWLLQVAIRQDELQQLLMTLQGSTIWNMLGMQVKPHSLPQSRQAMLLKDLLGKGPTKGKGKGGKGKTKS